MVDSLAASDEAFGREECKGRHASGVVNWAGVDVLIDGNGKHEGYLNQDVVFV